MFDSLITASIKLKDLSYIEKFPSELLSERENECKKWVINYTKSYGEVPTLERFQESEYGDYESDHLTNSPLQDLYDLSFNTKRNRFAASKLRELELEMENGDLNASSIISLGHRLSNFSSNPIIDLANYDREALYSYSNAGLNFGFPVLDNCLGGILPGEIGVFVAKPETGKSLLMMFIAWNVITNYGKDLLGSPANENSGKRVLFLSGEMVKDQIIARFDGIAGSFNPKILRTKHDEKLLKLYKQQAIDGWSKVRGQLFTPEKIVNSTEQMLEYCNQYQPDLVIFDAPYRMSSYGKGVRTWQDDRQLVLDLSSMAKNNDMRLLITTQLKTESNLANLSVDDIGYSKSYGEEADFAVAMWREVAQPNVIRAKPIKSRNSGKNGTIAYKPDFSKMNLEEYED